MLSLIPILLLAPAAPNFGDVLKADDAIAVALEASPRVRAARARLEAARARVSSEGWWPEPSLMVSASPLPVETRNGPAWASAQLKQPFPWTEALEARSEGAEARARGAAQALREVELGLARGLRHACYGLWRSEAELKINRRSVEIVKRLIEQAQARLAVAVAAQPDVLLAQVELARLENEAIDLQQHARTGRAAINSLMAQPLQAALPVAAPPRPRPTQAVDALINWATESHPALARMQSEIEARQHALRAVSYAGHPKLWAGLGYTFIQASDAPASESNGRDVLSLSFGTTLPVWGDYGAAERGASEAVRAAREARDAAEDMQVFRVMELHTRVETALRRVRLFEDAVLPLARQTLEVLEGAYATGSVGFMKLLEAQRALERFEVQQVKAQTDFELRLADLEHAVGRPLKGVTK